ncbi:MAG TPA: ferritin family protein [Synergistales bacterium]|nr:ferritin family protein [Synergistaceae bacterium]MDD3917450.1 ferritin family protein [Synergistaceae bacterium]HPE67262.1 ferritin family protein [Synergistales bacterium]HRW00059.1 ferritin family protein [Aminobacteriaceae bacterium]
MTEKSFNMKDALRYGIHAEIEAKNFYHTWAESVQEEHLKKELSALSDWESEHEASLMNYYEKLFGAQCPIDPNMVVEPELHVQTKDFGDTTSLLRVASAAYLSEMRAMEFYERLEKESTGETSAMFRKIKDMEKEHMDITKKRYMKIREDVVGFRAF